MCVSVCARTRNRRRLAVVFPQSLWPHSLIPFVPLLLVKHHSYFKGQWAVLDQNLWTNRRKESELILKIFFAQWNHKHDQRFDKKFFPPRYVLLFYVKQVVLWQRRKKKKFTIYHLLCQLSDGNALSCTHFTYGNCLLPYVKSSRNLFKSSSGAAVLSGDVWHCWLQRHFIAISTDQSVDVLQTM